MGNGIILTVVIGFLLTLAYFEGLAGASDFYFDNESDEYNNELGIGDLNDSNSIADTLAGVGRILTFRSTYDSPMVSILFYLLTLLALIEIWIIGNPFK